MKKCNGLLLAVLSVVVVTGARAQRVDEPQSTNQRLPATDCNSTPVGCSTVTGSNAGNATWDGTGANPYSQSDDMSTIRTRGNPEQMSPAVPTVQPQVQPNRLDQNPRTASSERVSLPPDPPTEFQNFVAASTGERLAVYGSSLFRYVPSTFAPDDHAPVPAGYVLGPGDELNVRIWGQVNYAGRLVVDREGVVYIPQVGPVAVAGLPFSAVDGKMRSAVGRVFRNFDLSADMGRLHAIQIYVAGAARRPGAYTVSSLSTLVNALFATGGPGPQGSLRHVLLKRTGQTVSDFDLYTMLLHGDTSKDLRLQPEDVLFIPPAGPQAAILGSVRVPAIYELREGETIADLLQMAGGKSTVASDARLSIDRLEEAGGRGTLEVKAAGGGLSSQVRDGDIIRVFSTVPTYQKTVTLRGNLANPGRFAWKEGLRLADLIPDQGSLMTRNYWWKRSHLGLPAPEFEPWVQAPGALLEDLKITSSTGTSPATTGLDGNSQNQSLAVQSAQAGTDPNPRNRGGAELTPQLRLQQQQAQILERTEIQVTEPGMNWDYAVVERTDPKTLQTQLLPFNLGKLVLEHDGSQNLALEPGDVVTIFSTNDVRSQADRQIRYVLLEGEVGHAGYYSVHPGESLRDIVARAGGVSSKAYLFGSEFTRVSTQKQQQQRIDEYVQSVSADAESGSQALLLSPSTNPNATANAASAQLATQQMVARLSKLKATGRIVLPFEPYAAGLDAIPNLPLENGDRFIVPSRPDTVSVVGAVYDQNAFVYAPKHTVGYYLNLAGGASRNADPKHAFVIRADGSVVSRMHMNGKGFFKASFEDQPMYAGDTIVVPDKTLHPTALRNFLDWSQIFSQLALGAAAIRVL